MESNGNSNIDWLADWGIDIKELIFEAAVENFQEDGTVASDEDKEKIRKIIDDNFK